MDLLSLAVAVHCLTLIIRPRLELLDLSVNSLANVRGLSALHRLSLLNLGRHKPKPETTLYY